MHLSAFDDDEEIIGPSQSPMKSPGQRLQLNSGKKIEFRSENKENLHGDDSSSSSEQLTIVKSEPNSRVNLETTTPKKLFSTSDNSLNVTTKPNLNSSPQWKSKASLQKKTTPHHLNSFLYSPKKDGKKKLNLTLNKSNRMRQSVLKFPKKVEIEQVMSDWKSN